MDVEIYKALSDESRLRILNILMQRKLCVCEIEIVLEMSQSNVSRHLMKLKNADIVLSNKEAQWVYYAIDDKFINNNHYLYAHLKNEFSKDEALLKDIEKLYSDQIKCEEIGIAQV